MKRFFIVLAFCLLAIGQISAQEVERIYTNSGKVYSGYISRQPTTGTYLQFIAEKQFITLPADARPVLSPEKKDFDRLPEAVRDWLRSEQGIHGGTVTLYKVTTKSSSYYGVYLLNSSTPVSFVSFGRTLLNIPYSDIQKICRNESVMPEGEGVVTILEMADGLQYKGDLLEQYPGVSVTLRADDGITRSIPYEDVVAIRYEPLDKGKSILEQIPLYDRVVMKDGARYLGVITSRDLKLKQVVFQDQDASYSRVIDAKEIAAYEKTPTNNNWGVKEQPEEEPLKPVLIDTCGRDYNRLTIVTEKVAVSKKITEERTRSVVTTPVSELVTVDTRSGDVRFNFETDARSSQISIRHAREYSAKEMKWNQTMYVVYPAIYQEDEVPAVEYDFDKVDGRTILDVTFRQTGLYVICFDGSDNCIAVKVNVSGSAPWLPVKDDNAN